MAPRRKKGYSHYRCERVFGSLGRWLRKNGVKGHFPLHSLRKEYGSRICDKLGIYAASQALRHADITAEELTATMQSFYFDTALSAPSGFPSLLAFAPRGHVVFGTDYPYASEAVSKKFTRNMDNYDHFKTDELDEINRGARTLFPRIRA